MVVSAADKRKEYRKKIARKNKVHMLLMEQKRLGELESRYPDFYAYVRSGEFLYWYASVTGGEWNEEMELDPVQAINHIQYLKIKQGDK